MLSLLRHFVYWAVALEAPVPVLHALWCHMPRRADLHAEQTRQELWNRAGIVTNASDFYTVRIDIWTYTPIITLLFVWTSKRHAGSRHRHVVQYPYRFDNDVANPLVMYKAKSREDWMQARIIELQVAAFCNKIAAVLLKNDWWPVSRNLFRWQLGVRKIEIQLTGDEVRTDITELTLYFKYIWSNTYEISGPFQQRYSPANEVEFLQTLSTCIS